MSGTFTPPRYTEQTFAIFDTRSGQVLATETRWVLQDRSAGKVRVGGKEEPTASHALLKSIAAAHARSVQKLGVLPLTKTKSTSMVLSHIDIARRQPVYVKINKAARNTPLQIDRP